MSNKEIPAPTPSAIQVFELTMDNPEDQDQLNRQLTKPEKAKNISSAMLGHGVQGESTSESGEQKGRTKG